MYEFLRPLQRVTRPDFDPCRGVSFFFCVPCAKTTALAASEILRNESKVLTEVIDNNRCLLEFMDMMDSHKKVSA